MTTIELAKRLNLSQPTISKSVKRGEMVAIDNGFKVINDDNVVNILASCPQSVNLVSLSNLFTVSV